MEQLRNHLITALMAAANAGKAILEIYNKHFEVEYKDDRSPLTLADRRSHEIIIRHLSELEKKPLSILSEEGKDIPFEQRRRWEYFWLIDPLDGTKEFVKRNDEFTVNLALIHKERPILGVVYVPVKDTYYFAAEELGAYRLNQGGGNELATDRLLEHKKDEVLKTIMARSTRLPLSDSRFAIHDSRITIVGSRSHATKELDEFVETMRKKYKEVEFIAAGSSLKLCLVAEGRADIYPRLGPTMEWDTAAGQAVVEAAGGSVVEAETDEPLKYNKESLLNPWFIVRRKGI